MELWNTAVGSVLWRVYTLSQNEQQDCYISSTCTYELICEVNKVLICYTLQVEKGYYHMVPPISCPQDIKTLMLDCWDYVPNRRPNFSEILSKLEARKLKLAPNEYINIA